MYAVVVQCVTAENEDIQSVLLYLLWALANRLIVICKSYEQTSKRQFRRNSFKNFEICFCSISKRWENLRNAFFLYFGWSAYSKSWFEKNKKKLQNQTIWHRCNVRFRRASQRASFRSWIRWPWRFGCTLWRRTFWSVSPYSSWPVSRLTNGTTLTHATPTVTSSKISSPSPTVSGS